MTEHNHLETEIAAIETMITDLRPDSTIRMLDSLLRRIYGLVPHPVTVDLVGRVMEAVAAAGKERLM